MLERRSPLRPPDDPRLIHPSVAVVQVPTLRQSGESLTVYQVHDLFHLMVGIVLRRFP